MFRKIANRINTIRRIQIINNQTSSRISFYSYVDKNSYFQGYNMIGSKCSIVGCNIGKYSYLGMNCKLDNTDIGKYCSIAGDLQIISGNHPTQTFVSTHPLFYEKDYFGQGVVGETIFQEYTYADKEKGKLVVIGNDVWIGTGVKILNGITIGDGAIIGMGAVVTKDVPPYSIIGGVPAKVIKYRFDRETIDMLLKFKWWDKEESWIKEHGLYFKSIDDFKQLLNGGSMKDE